MAATQKSVPIVDFSPFFDGTTEGKIKAGKAMVKVMNEFGFMYVINHGIPKEEQDKAFAWSKKFFEMTEEQKMKCPMPEDGAHERGYSPIGKEKVMESDLTEEQTKELRQVVDIKESFDVGDENHKTWCNFWPDEQDIPGFKEFALHYYDLCTKTSWNFLQAIALGLGLEEDYLVKNHSDKESVLRFLHYPSTNENDLKTGKTQRISPHTDYGTMTLLLQDEVGGLEVEDPYNKGHYLPVPYIEGSLVVNTADCLEQWSNDMLKSTMHTVKAPPVNSETGISKERFSIPFFVSANADTIVEALEGTYSEENPKKYEPITAGEHLIKRLRATY